VTAKRYALHGLGITLASVLAILVSPYLFQGVGELGWESLLFRIRGARPADPRLVYAAIDDDSIAKLGAFPWPRDVHAKLIDKLAGLGVKKIVYDVMFFDLSAWPKKDKALVKAARRAAGKLVLAVSYSGVCGTPEPMRVSPKIWSFKYSPTSDCKVKIPFNALAKAGESFGSNNARAEADGSIRSVPVYSLGLVRGPTGLEKGANRGHPPSLAAAALDLGDEDLAAEGIIDPLPLNFRAPAASNPYRMVPVSRILSGELRPEENAALSGAIVVVGSASRKAFDEYRSPFGEPMPGPFVLLTLIDNLLHHDYLSTSFAVYLALSALGALFITLVEADTPVFMAGAAALSVSAVAAAILAFWRGILIVWPGAAVPLLVGCAWTIVLRTRSRRLRG
jgi:CHASE2 domain-containing sensor protein